MSTDFNQYDSRWGAIKYPSGSDTMSNSGCGATACADIVVNNPKYKSVTPKDTAKYMVEHNYAIKSAGTSWNGISSCMKHYGFSATYHEGMSTFFAEMAKGDRWGIVLFRGGSRGGVTWTNGGHFVTAVNYRVRNGEHELYIYDGGQRQNDGWFSYEKHMYGLIPAIWTFHLPKNSKPKKTTAKSQWYMTKANWKKVQSWFGCNATGYVGGQDSEYKKNYKGLGDILKNVDGSGKSDSIKAIQKWLGVPKTGLITPSMVKALQKKLGVKDVNGIWGDITSKALINYISTHEKPAEKKPAATTTKPATTTAKPTTKKSTKTNFLYASTYYASRVEKKPWKYSNKNSKTSWSSANKNHIINCARLMSFVMQYSGVLSKGKCVYYKNGFKGNGVSQLLHSNKVKIYTPKVKIKNCKLQEGDIVCTSNHMMMYRGKNSKGKRIWDSAGSSDMKAHNCTKRVKSSYDNKRCEKIIRPAK